MDYHTGDKWFIHGSEQHKEDQLLNLKHPRWFYEFGM